MLITQMTEREVPAVARLEGQIFSAPWSEQGFSDTLAMENVLFLVANDGEEVCGYCGVYLAADEGEITNVAVARPYRRRGIAERLVRALIEKTASYGIQNYILEVRISNDAAIKLYEKIGFKRCAVRRGFYEKPREDACVMHYHVDDTPVISTVRQD